MSVDPDSAKTNYFLLESPVMKSGDILTKRYAGKSKENLACDGEDISLPLHWYNQPEGTKSFAFIMLDPIGRRGLGVVHWIAYDIPVTKTWLAEGEASGPSQAFIGGKNDSGSLTWHGPCPRFDVPTRPYTIVLIATDLEPGQLEPGLTYRELVDSLDGHALESTDFIVRYR